MSLPRACFNCKKRFQPSTRFTTLCDQCYIKTRNGNKRVGLSKRWKKKRGLI